MLQSMLGWMLLSRKRQELENPPELAANAESPEAACSSSCGGGERDRCARTDNGVTLLRLCDYYEVEELKVSELCYRLTALGV